jgi:cytidylate kinase
MDKELLVKVAVEAELPLSEVEGFDEQPEHPLMRALRKFIGPSYGGASAMTAEEWSGPVAFPVLSNLEESRLSSLDEDSYVKLTQKIMLRLANEGNVLLMGRGSQALLGHRRDVLHVRVVAPRDFRVRTTQERDKVGKSEAARIIKRYDEQRIRYIKRHYDLNPTQPEHYHLVVNTERLGVEGAVHSIVAAARHLPVAVEKAVGG